MPLGDDESSLERPTRERVDKESIKNYGMDPHPVCMSQQYQMAPLLSLHQKARLVHSGT